MLSDGQSVQELVENGVSLRSPPSLSAVFFLLRKEVEHRNFPIQGHFVI